MFNFNLLFLEIKILPNKMDMNLLENLSWGSKKSSWKFKLSTAFNTRGFIKPKKRKKLSRQNNQPNTRFDWLYESFVKCNSNNIITSNHKLVAHFTGLIVRAIWIFPISIAMARLACQVHTLLNQISSCRTATAYLYNHRHITARHSNSSRPITKGLIPIKCHMFRRRTTSTPTVTETGNF